MFRTTTMEFVEGHTLVDWLERQGTLSEDDALAIAQSVAEIQ